MIRHIVTSQPTDDYDDMPPLVESDDSDNEQEPARITPAPKRRAIVPDTNNHDGIDVIPDFYTQAINFYLTHQNLCFANTPLNKPMLPTLQAIARRIEIRCLQTVFENERLMVAVRLEAIK